MDYGEFLVCLERRMKEWDMRGGKMKTCEACVNKSTIGCRHGVEIENAPPWDLEETYGCTLHKAKPIEFETTFTRWWEADGPCRATFPENDVLVGTKLFGRKFKVTCEPVDE